jgi:hypothetical protein
VRPSVVVESALTVPWVGRHYSQSPGVPKRDGAQSDQRISATITGPQAVSRMLPTA